jgi:hypothetical protein
LSSTVPVSSPLYSSYLKNASPLTSKNSPTGSSSGKVNDDNNYKKSKKSSSSSPNKKKSYTNKIGSQRSSATSSTSPGRDDKMGVHMSTSDMAKARSSIRSAILHKTKTLHGGTEGVHELWNTYFCTYRQRGDTGIRFSSFKIAIRRSLNITSTEISDTHLRGLFDKIDDTHDGFISFVEFRDWLGGSKRRTNGSYTAGKFCVYFHVYISGIQCFETFQTILFSHKLQTLFNFLK